MRILTRFVLIALLSSPNATTQNADDIEVLFSPKGGCTEAVIREINAAKATVRIQAYSFTSQAIAHALLGAKKRGVQVSAILDSSNRTDRYSAATFLSNQDCPVSIDDRHKIAHNKIIIIDDAVVITGSFNFTKSAEESNAENLLVIRNRPDIVKQYLENWEQHLRHSEPYRGPATTRPSSAKSKPANSTGRPETNDTEVYVSKSGKRYHRANCKSITDAQKVPLSEAKAKGKTPCKICQPPE